MTIKQVKYYHINYFGIVLRKNYTVTIIYKPINHIQNGINILF